MATAMASCSSSCVNLSTSWPPSASSPMQTPGRGQGSLSSNFSVKGELFALRKRHVSCSPSPSSSCRRERRVVAMAGGVLGLGFEGESDVGARAGGGSAMMQRSAEGDVMGLLLRQRIVFLGHQMDDYVADAVVSQLLLLDAQDPNKEIRLFVNCPGGSISAAMAIYDAIQLCRAEVSTIAFGLSASTATVVLAGGSKGRRYAMPNARVMMHQPMGGASGQAIDVEIQAKEIMYHKKNITSILAQITNKTYEQVEKDIDRDRYMSPIEAMEYGIIDGVIDKDTIIPLLPVPERVKHQPGFLAADSTPRQFLIPIIPDDEIY